MTHLETEPNWQMPSSAAQQLAAADILLLTDDVTPAQRQQALSTRQALLAENPDLESRLLLADEANHPAYYQSERRPISRQFYRAVGCFLRLQIS